MEISCSRQFADFDDLGRRFEANLSRSIKLRRGHVKNRLRPVSFDGCDLELPMLKSHGSGKMMFEGSLISSCACQSETMFSLRTPPAELENSVFGRSMNIKNRENGDQFPLLSSLSKRNAQTIVSGQGDQRNLAALKLQKVYKSFRTRRQLADCAVLVEQKWWKLLDFAELKRSSVSFFNIEKPETAISRWSRARTRAAKVGKGLSKDLRARKLALQHWLEAIDPRHRYGHNLQFYYVNWLQCESRQPFFYWLDIGGGKEVNLERCPRSKLQLQCIKYLGPTERENYEVVVENGKFLYKQSGNLIDTTRGPKGTKWILVLSTSKTFYVGQKNKGTFQHSSFLAGGATLSAGRLVVEEGVLKAVWPHSGHYLPTEENFQEFRLFLKEHNVDLSLVREGPSEDEEETLTQKETNLCLWENPSRADLSQDTEIEKTEAVGKEITDLRKQDSSAAENTHLPLSRLSRRIGSKIAKLKIPERSEAPVSLKKEESTGSCYDDEFSDSSDDDGYETAEESFVSKEEFHKLNLFEEDEEEESETAVPKEKIMKRIDSHKGMKSYQLPYHMSSKWTTGAGPRIGCMRDYPSELQFQVLEKVNLSPRRRIFHAPHASLPNLPHLSPRILTPTSLCREGTSSPLSADSMMMSQTATP